MHDLVHDVSLEVSENYCCHLKDWKVGTNKIEAMHLFISSGERGMWKNLRDYIPLKLRTLHLECCGDLPEDLFQNFKCLSALIVKNNDAKELPYSIGKMKHLRFLDIGGCHLIKRLPESFTKLYYLQTLIAWELEELPIGFRNLINLRHIHMETYQHSKVLFEGLSHLRNLQTLPFFRVGKQKGCSIEEIEHLNNLKGKLRICGLENVGSYESAMKSNLSKKSNIQVLDLEWDERDEGRDDSDVVEGLKPHPNLKSLHIHSCQSSKFPSWMVGQNRLLCNLVHLTLTGLNKWERLPSVGHLPFLKDLVIRSLEKVKSIEKEFITVFPALRRLELQYMESLVEWSDATEMSSAVQCTIFRDLEEIILEVLPNLSVFPNLGSLPSLKKLRVLHCGNLRIREEWANDDEIRSYFQSLRQLDLSRCDNFAAPICSMSLVQLESLSIVCHPNSWPKDLHYLINLKELDLQADLTDREGDEFDCYPVWPYPKSDFVSLRTLRLYGSLLPRVKYLPDQIQYLTALTYLRIFEFDGLEALPEWLGNLQSLQSLVLLECKNLKLLPSAEAIQRLTHLHTLEIYACPLLQEKCKRGSGSEWIKIAHIPHLDLTRP